MCFLGAECFGVFNGALASTEISLNIDLVNRMLFCLVISENKMCNMWLFFFFSLLPYIRRATRRVRELWWQGLPPSVRGKVWSLAVGNELNITPGMPLTDHMLMCWLFSKKNVNFCLKKLYVFLSEEMDFARSGTIVLQLDIVTS